MALPSSPDSPVRGQDTPAGYRLDTSAVLVVTRPITTAEHAVIQRSIEPRTGWWQFELRPWHYWTAISSAVVITAAFVTLLVRTGAIR